MSTDSHGVSSARHHSTPFRTAGSLTDDSDRRILVLRFGGWLLAPETEPVLDLLDDAFYALDGSWNFVRINRAAERYWQRSREALLGKNIWHCFPNAIGSEPYEMHLKCAATNSAVQFLSISPVIGSQLAIRIERLADGIGVCFRETAPAKLRPASAPSNAEPAPSIRILRLAQNDPRASERVLALKPLSYGDGSVICTCGGCGSVLVLTDRTTDLNLLIECGTCYSVNVLNGSSDASPSHGGRGPHLRVAPSGLTGKPEDRGWQRIASAPFDRELELAVIDYDGVHSLAFSCRRVLGGWIKADTRQRIEVYPSHWRDW